MDKVIIYTDGSCSGNPGRGGWGAILMYKNHKKRINGGSHQTTNNKMELQAVIESLKILKRECAIDIYTDSNYVKDGITKWIFNWKKNGWKNSAKKEIKNQEQWIELDELSQKHKIEWHWVKGHADNELNNEVDELAKEGINLIS
jgi:ribonuclease HI